MAVAEHLKNIELLSDLPEEELSSLSRLLHKQEYEKNAVITLKSDNDSSLMFIAKGRVRVSLSTTEGKEVVITYLDAGQFFGEISFLTGDTRSADVSALKDTVLLTLGKADFEKHNKSFSGLITKIAVVLAQRLAASSHKIGDLALLDVYSRVVSQLKGLGKEMQDGSTRYWYIAEKPTHQELAAMIGTSREMVSRAMKELEAEEVLVKDGKALQLRSAGYAL